MVREIASCYEVRVTPVPRRIRYLVLLGCVGLAVSIVLGLGSRAEWIGYVAAAAAATALLGLHRLGRAGPDSSVSVAPGAREP